ncbi:hypothetical protein [Aeromonas dhakensis]|uniref:hypothetical protein n=1 Tax=Aeromonas dhakensis TaxID=196024 RepID=UPI0013E01144|nr:hypothetical protein [Aeromonas dhakensis]WDF95343.1 hypothetical protein PUB92_02910 [Aeromonas dhakensis]
MKIIIVSKFDAFSNPEKEDHILLSFREWDDYGTKSTYRVRIYLKSIEKYAEIGEAKIISTSEDDYDDKGHLTISGTFHELPGNLGFLGQSEDFYLEIKKYWASTQKKLW